MNNSIRFKNFIKKISILILLFTFLCFSFKAIAQESIMSLINVTVSDKTNTTIVNNMIFDNQSITSDITFHSVDDYVTFELTLKNNTSKNYTLEELTLPSSSSYLTYTCENCNNVDVSSNGEINITLTAKYNTQVQNIDDRTQNIDFDLQLKLLDENGNIVNPQTDSNINLYIILAISSFLGLVLIVSFSKKNSKDSMTIFLMFVFVATSLPTIVNAITTSINLDFIGKIELFDRMILTTMENNEEKKELVPYGNTIPLPSTHEDRLGYNFVGWVDENGELITEPQTAVKDITYLPKYSLIEYSITFILNDGVLQNAPSSYTVETDDFTLPQPTRDGYSFDGWTESNNTPQQVIKIEKGTTGNKTYTANWSITTQVDELRFITKQTKTINLTNAIPITNANLANDNINVGTVEIEVVGSNNSGIEYLITSDNAHITTSDGWLIPISLDIATTNIGSNSNNYFSTRNGNTTNYKDLSNNTLNGEEMLLAGYIKPNETFTSNSKIVIKAYIDADNVVVSDNYNVVNQVDGPKIISTSEWNNLVSNGITFDVVVEAHEGTWLNEKRNAEISGSNFITMLNEGNTSSKYEIIRDTIESDPVTPTWFISTTNSNLSMNNGIITINQNNLSKSMTIGATIKDKTIYKNIKINNANEPLENIMETIPFHEKEFASYYNGSIVDNNVYERSDYIEIDRSKSLFFKGWLDSNATIIMVFYDENKNFVSGINESNVNDSHVYSIDGALYYGKVVNIPDDAKYMIIDRTNAGYNLNCYAYHYIENNRINLVDMTVEYTSSNSLNGLNIVNFGDSIFGSRVVNTNISDFLNTYFGSTNYNIGFGGTRMAQHPSAAYDAYSMYNLAYAISTGDYSLQESNNINDEFSSHLETLKSINFSNIDYATIALGTNDFTGQLLYHPSESESLNTRYYAGATRYSINKLREVNPNIKIVLLTPIYRFWDTYSDASNRSGTIYFSEYVNALKKIALEYDNIYLFDGYNELGINSINRYIYFDYRDSVHPNINGIKLYAYKLGKFIENIENQ